MEWTLQLMPIATIPQSILRSQLQGEGHELYADDVDGTDVGPSANVVVHLDIGADPVVYPEYRNNYFGCYWTADGRLNAEFEPTLEFQGVWRELAQRDGLSNLGDSFATSDDEDRSPKKNTDLTAFLNGPMRWLISRIKRFDRIVLWPSASLRRSLMQLATGREVPEVDAEEFALGQRMQAAGIDSSFEGALVLDVSQPEDCELVWLLARVVSCGFCNAYLADSSFCDVYELHHHNRIAMSIPSGERRQQLLDDLTKLDDVFVNCSGYTSPSDDDDDEDNGDEE